MNTIEANIKITRQGDKLTSVSVNMPIWDKKSEKGDHHVISLPFLCIQTIAKDEKDADKAIEEAITSFCIVSEKFGQGIEKELQSLGWIHIDGETGEPVLGYNITDDPDSVLDRIMQTGDSYVNSHLDITCDA